MGSSSSAATAVAFRAARPKVSLATFFVAFFAVLWTKGFGPEDRELFRMNKADVKELREAEARDQIGDDIV